MTKYAKRSFEKNLIYPDNHNDENKGYRAPYFYLHGDIEHKAGYDCFNVSPELLVQLLSNKIHLATTIIGEESYKCIVFSQFKYDRMQGYAVLIDSLEDIKDALDEFPNSFNPCSGDTPDEYLQEEYPDAFNLIMDFYRKKKNYE